MSIVTKEEEKHKSSVDEHDHDLEDYVESERGGISAYHGVKLYERRSLKESVELDMMANDENREPNVHGWNLQRNLPYQVYKAAEVDGNILEYETKKILNKEEELMKKARDLENEMLQIKQAKVDMVIRQFEAQLMKEADLEEKRHTETLRD